MPACSTLTNVVTGTPCHRHRTWHSTPSQYTDTGPTCHCAIHWCRMSHWNAQLPIFIVLDKTRSGHPSPTFHTRQQTHNFMMLLWWLSVKSLVESVPYTHWVLWPGTCGVRIHYAIRSPTAGRRPNAGPLGPSPPPVSVSCFILYLCLYHVQKHCIIKRVITFSVSP